MCIMKKIMYGADGKPEYVIVVNLELHNHLFSILVLVFVFWC